mgnify:FL=1
MEMEILAVIVSVISILSSVLVSIFTIYSNRKSQRVKAIFEAKITAIQNAEEYIDDYIAIMDSDPNNVRKTISDKQGYFQLTLDARKHYNALFNTVENKEIVNAFYDILMKSSGKFTMELFAENIAFKNLCRTELGQKEIEVNNCGAIVKIRSAALEHKLE